MTSAAPQNCRRCARRMHAHACPCGEHSQTRTAQIDPDRIIRHTGRGLCANCYRVAKRNNALNDYPHLPTAGGRGDARPAEHTIEDFRDLIELQGGRRAPTKIGYTKATREAIAIRLGMTLDALDRALYRAAV